MNRFKNHLIAAAVLSVLAIIGTIMNSRPSVLEAAGGPTVTIDQAQLPLPVQGSTTVSGTVAAKQSGVWNVGITPGASVNVGNPATSPVPTVNQPGPLTNVGRLASELVTLKFAKTCDPSGSGNGWALVSSHGSFSMCFLTIPAGKALVITDFEWSQSGETPGNVMIQGLNVSDTVTPIVVLESSATVGANGLVGGSAHSTTGVVVTSANQLNSAQGSFSDATVSGYLVPNQ
jgi:hypothetical protein